VIDSGVLWVLHSHPEASCQVAVRIVSYKLYLIFYLDHIMLSPGDAGNNDRFIMQDIIKEMASNRNIAAIAGTGGEGKKATGAQFKTVVLMEVDRLSRQAQAALRRTMEKYASSCRLILCCNSQSKVIEPVRSRCLGIRVGAPTEDEVSPIYLTS
jgi:replication factor C subunit 3/5